MMNIFFMTNMITISAPTARMFSEAVREFSDRIWSQDCQREPGPSDHGTTQTSPHSHQSSRAPEALQVRNRRHF